MGYLQSHIQSKESLWIRATFAWLYGLLGISVFPDSLTKRVCWYPGDFVTDYGYWRASTKKIFWEKLRTNKLELLWTAERYKNCYIRFTRDCRTGNQNTPIKRLSWIENRKVAQWKSVVGNIAVENWPSKPEGARLSLDSSSDEKTVAIVLFRLM